MFAIGKPISVRIA